MADKVIAEHDMSDHDLLIRLSVEMQSITRDIARLQKLVESNLVSRDEFDPVKRVAYGLVGAILFAVVAGLLSLIIL